MKNAPGFTFPNKDTPKTRPVLYPKPCRRTFRGVCFCAPTWVRTKFARFHISAHGHAKNAPGFRRKPLSQDISGRMQYAPTRVHEKFGGFHISASEYAKNAPRFTFPNRNTPKTRPVLDANPCRRLFERRMQYAPIRIRAKFDGFHIPPPGYAKNAPDFTLPNKDSPKTRPVLYQKTTSRGILGRMQYAPTRIRAKFDGF